MIKVLTVGVFDYFHYGHLRLFERARALGDYLVVAVQDGDYILKYKHDAEILYCTEQRVQIISALRCVDEVITYQDVDRIVQTVDFDVFAVGGDQSHQGFQMAIAWCNANGKKVVRLERTAGISSSQIKKNI